MSLALLKPDVQPVTPQRHAARSWRGPANYSFAANTALLPIYGAEIGAAAMTLPLAFIAHEGAHIPVAVLGLEVGKSLLVSSDGNWQGGYLPLALRSYPFMLVPAGDGRQLLCVDEGCNLVREGADGKPFFEGDQNALSPVLTAILEALGRSEQARVPTVAACETLQRHDLLRPWPLVIPAAQGDRNVEGLFCVDEAAVNALPDEAFLDLRRNGALALAYAQMLSMQHMESLLNLALNRARVAAQLAQSGPSGSLDLSFLGGDTIRF